MTKEELIEQMVKKLVEESNGSWIDMMIDAINETLSNPELLKASGYIPESEVKQMIVDAIDKYKLLVELTKSKEFYAKANFNLK